MALQLSHVSCGHDVMMSHDCHNLSHSRLSHGCISEVPLNYGQSTVAMIRLLLLTTKISEIVGCTEG